MSSNPTTDIVMAACLLKATNPQAFSQLVEAFRALEIQSITDLLAGDAPHDMFRNQGRVKTIQHLRRHLQDCNSERDKYTRR